MTEGRDWRAIVGWVALAFVLLEIVSAFFIEFPAAALVFGALFLIGWFLVRRGGMAGVIFVGVLCVVELIGLPFYAREDADDWIIQALVLVLSLTGIVAAILALRQRDEADAGRTDRIAPP